MGKSLRRSWSGLRIHIWRRIVGLINVVFSCVCRCKRHSRELMLASESERADDLFVIGARVKYLLDRAFGYNWALVVMISILGIVQIAIGGFLYASVWRYSDKLDGRDEEDVNRYTEGIWIAWTFFSSPAPHASVFRPEQRIIGWLITFCGMAFFASILGVSVDVFRGKMDALRKGKSKIIESDHILILGWTQKTFHVIEELCYANENQYGGTVVVLAAGSKERMEAELRLQLPEKSRRGSRVIIRSGSPLVMGDLVRVSAHMAKAIIILAAGDRADEADATTLRALLSLNTLFNTDLVGHIVAEARDLDNEPLVKLVGNQGVETVVSHDIVGRLMLMSVRQPGLARVYEALLGFEGDEFYMEEWPELVGLSFGELQLRFPDAVPIGIFASDGTLYLNPASAYELQSGDEIIVIAEDDNSYCPKEPMLIEAADPPHENQPEHRSETILICGWRRDVRDILQQLDMVAKKGTEVHLMTHCLAIKDRNQRLLEDGLDVSELQNIALVHHFGNTTVRRHLERLPIERFTSTMIFADQAFENDSMYADSHSLTTLLLLRDVQAHRVRYNPCDHGDPRQKESVGVAIARLSDILSNNHIIEQCPSVCEILDHHTQKLLENNEHLGFLSDFCQANRLIAQVLAMVAEERAVKILLDEILGSSGCSIAVVPSSRYAHEQEQINFFELCLRAQSLSELLLGYHRRHSIEKTILNPRDKRTPLVWDSYDFAILRGEVGAVDTGPKRRSQRSLQLRRSSNIEDRETYENLESMQLVAKAFAVAVMEAEDPKSRCIAAFAALSNEDRAAASVAVSFIDEALQHRHTNLEEASVKDSIGSRETKLIRKLSPSGDMLLGLDDSDSQSVDSVTPSRPRPSCSAPATLPRLPKNKYKRHLGPCSYQS